MLVSYFGELDSKPCGICTFCKKYQSRKMTLEQTRNFQNMVLNALRDKFLQVSELVESLAGISKDQAVEIITEMTDQGIIVYDATGKIGLPEK